MSVYSWPKCTISRVPILSRTLPLRAIQHSNNNENVGLSFVVLTLLRCYDYFFLHLSVCAFAMDRLNCSLPMYAVNTIHVYEWDRRLTYFFCLYIWPPPNTNTPPPYVCVGAATVMQQTYTMKMRIFVCYLFALVRRVYAAKLKIRMNIEHFHWWIVQKRQSSNIQLHRVCVGKVIIQRTSTISRNVSPINHRIKLNGH